MLATLLAAERNNFDSHTHLALCDAMPCQLHHREVTFSNCLLDIVKSNFDRPFRSFGRHFGPCIRTEAPVEANNNTFERDILQGNVLFI